MPVRNIPRIELPTPSIRRIPRPITSRTPPPITRGISPPTINVPDTSIEYPTIDVPTEEQFRGDMKPREEPQPIEEEDTREISEPKEVPLPSEVNRPTINIGGIEAPLPEPAPLITAGATAVVTTVVALGATIAIGQIKKLIEPMMKRASSPSKKKKVKIKQVKPVLHYVLGEDDIIDIFEYSQTGTKLVGQTDDVEKYVRDQVESDGLYEYDNKVIIDDVIQEKFTKEGAKRFKPLFAPAKSIAKKLSAKFSI